MGHPSQPTPFPAASQAAYHRHGLFRWTLVLTATALVVNVLLAWNTYGTNDVDMYLTSSRVAQGKTPIELYQHRILVQQVNGGTYSEVFNHPPLILFLLGKLGKLQATIDIPFHTLFRLLSGLASIATVLLVYSLAKDRVESSWNLLLYALSPVSILVAGFHGNTDPWMILFLVATVWSVERQHPPWLSGVFFSFAFSIKIVPLFLVPALFFGLRGARERVICFSSIGVSTLAMWLPYLIQDYKAVLKAIFGYGSQYGLWGIGYLTEGTIVFWKYSFYGKYAILLLCVLLGWCMNRTATRISLFDQFGITLYLFLFLTPGFGVQYLYWLTPWAVMLGTGVYFWHWASSGIFLFVVYNWWCRGLPWWYADSITAPLQLTAKLLGVLSWISVGCVLLSFYRRYPAVFLPAVNLVLSPRSVLRVPESGQR